MGPDLGLGSASGSFHAIDSRPVSWTGPEAGDWSLASAVDRDCASGLVSSLVISVVVKLTFSLRRPATGAYELHRRLLVGAWRAVELVPVRVGGTHPTASMPLTPGVWLKLKVLGTARTAKMETSLNLCRPCLISSQVN